MMYVLWKPKLYCAFVKRFSCVISRNLNFFFYVGEEIIIIEIYIFIAHTILHVQTCKRNLIWEFLDPAIYYIHIKTVVSLIKF